MVRSRAGLGSGLRIIMDTWRTQSCRNFNLSQLLSAALSELNCLQLVIQSPLSSWSKFELLGIFGLIEVEIPSTEFKDSEKNLHFKSRIILQIDPNWSQDYECFALQFRQQQQWLWIDFPTALSPTVKKCTRRRSEGRMIWCSFSQFVSRFATFGKERFFRALPQ